jgi:hypothetical protein
MAIDWRTLCRAPKFELEGDDVVVEFENGRSHRVMVRETSELFEFHAVVAKRKAVEHVTNLAERIWRVNRAAQLVSFRIDAHGRVRAEGWVAKSGVTAEEFQLVLRRVAAESDRLEFLLTGRDVE